MQKRAKFHFQASKGWINDPNGLIYYNGQYHAFFQYNPAALFNDKIEWGHAVSTDLLNWQQKPSAIYPDREYDCVGCWSGSAIEKDGAMYLVYTSLSKEGCTVSVAISSDGEHFEKYAGNPVVSAPPFETGDFRDPKVARWKDEFIMVVGCGLGGNGKVLLYKSKDLLKWDYAGVLYEREGLANVFECPDFFPVGDKYVLMFSKIWHTESAVHFAVGTFDGERFVVENECEPQFGPQFFAAQTYAGVEGRTILQAWMYDWNRKPNEDDEFAGWLTIPMELTLKEGKVCLYPAAEAKGLIRDSAEGVVVSGNSICAYGKEILSPVAIEKVEFVVD